jgi:hypothetical protein
MPPKSIRDPGADNALPFTAFFNAGVTRGRAVAMFRSIAAFIASTSSNDSAFRTTTKPFKSKRNFSRAVIARPAARAVAAAAVAAIALIEV